jgi:predicted 3-demethylubiquinone-9 3-methyltransferase (glyoxalase superfamily)
VICDYFALNGPEFTFSPAMSMVAYCDTQEEMDTLWQKLTEGGEEGVCGWLTDKYRVSWQIVPRGIQELLNTEDTAASQRMFTALIEMKKLDIGALERVYEGGEVGNEEY